MSNISIAFGQLVYSVHSMLYSPRSSILSHRMQICILSPKIMCSIPQDEFSLMIYYSRSNLLKQKLKSVNFLPPCRLPLHFVLLDSAANSYIVIADVPFMKTYPKASQTGLCFSAALSLHL